MDEPKRATKVMMGALTAVAAARVIDLLLIGTSISAAVGSVTFAGYMVVRGDHTPQINGMQYLAIFAKPSGHAAPPEAPAATSLATAPVDMAPVGALAAKTAADPSGYSLVAARPDLAWLREGDRIFAVRPGQTVPRLGEVASIVWSEGRWSLLDPAGARLILGTRIEMSSQAPGPFSRRMIFGAHE